VTASNGDGPAAVSVAGSAWNADNRQYEEKSVLEWATERLQQLLCRLALDLGSGMQARVMRVADAKGMAAVTATQRGPGCVFSFDSVTCDWATADASGSLVIGEVDVTDVSPAEMDEPLAINAVAVTSGGGGGDCAGGNTAALSAAVRRAAASLLKPAFRDLLRDMQAEFLGVVH
jgi:hypothetical protein